MCYSHCWTWTLCPGMNIYTKIWFNEVCVCYRSDKPYFMLTDLKPDLVAMSWFRFWLIFLLECHRWLDISEQIGIPTGRLFGSLTVSLLCFLCLFCYMMNPNILFYLWTIMSIKYFHLGELIFSLTTIISLTLLYDQLLICITGAIGRLIIA